jgi:hypothetical protein
MEKTFLENYTVNASGTNAPDLNGAPQFRPDGGGVRPEGDANRSERGERDSGGPRWMFGLIKNIGVIAALVTIVVGAKSVAKRKRNRPQ